jgi:hypothetical protein
MKQTGQQSPSKPGSSLPGSPYSLAHTKDEQQPLRLRGLQPWRQYRPGSRALLRESTLCKCQARRYLMNHGDANMCLRSFADVRHFTAWSALLAYADIAKLLSVHVPSNLQGLWPQELPKEQQQ